MRSIALTVLCAACTQGGSTDLTVQWSESVDLPAGTAEVIDAVAALPECDALCAGGAVRWSSGPECSGDFSFGGICVDLGAQPVRIDAVYRADAWEGVAGLRAMSPLAKALCRVCGYTDGSDSGMQAEACALRANLRRGIGCSASQPASRRWLQVLEPPANTEAVVRAVAALPECWSVRAGVTIRWRSHADCGTPWPADACAFPGERPRRIEIVFRQDAWQGTTPADTVSTLAHELCHVCGYTGGPDRGEAAADACARRAARQAGRPTP